MSFDIWAVPLSFTCLVLMFAYIANEAARLVLDSRKKRKTLYRLSAASIQLIHANGALVTGEPLLNDPGPHSIAEDYPDAIPSPHRAAGPDSCCTWRAWSTPKGFPEPQRVARRTSREPAAASPPAGMRRGSKRLVHGRWSRALASPLPLSSCADEHPSSQRQIARTNRRSPKQGRVDGVVSNVSEFAKAFACKPSHPMVHASVCHVW
jgi:hypothetical protein